MWEKEHKCTPEQWDLFKKSVESAANVEEWQPAGKRPQRKAQWQGKQGNKQLSRREAYGTDHQHGDAGLGTLLWDGR